MTNSAFRAVAYLNHPKIKSKNPKTLAKLIKINLLCFPVWIQFV